MIIQRLPYSGISREAANCANNRLNSWQRKMQPNAVDIHVTFMEEEYEKFLKSEKTLLKMLDFVTIVCILILIVRRILSSNSGLRTEEERNRCP